jgi:hypothetical protein
MPNLPLPSYKPLLRLAPAVFGVMLLCFMRLVPVLPSLSSGTRQTLRQKDWEKETSRKQAGFGIAQENQIQ